MKEEIDFIGKFFENKKLFLFLGITSFFVVLFFFSQLNGSFFIKCEDTFRGRTPISISHAAFGVRNTVDEITFNYAEIGQFNDGGLANRVFVNEGYAFVTDLADGLEIIDLSDPANPEKVGQYKYNNECCACDVFVVDNYAYLTYHIELKIIDILDPTNPEEVGKWMEPGDIRSVYIVDDLAFVADAIDGLKIINISNPSNPYKVGEFNGGGVRDVFVHGAYAYVAQDDELKIIDIQNPSSPFLMGQYDGGGEINDVKVIGSYAFLADSRNGFEIISVGNPFSPSKVGGFDCCGFDVFIAGSTAYLSDFYDGLIVFNIHDVHTPQVIGRYYDGGEGSSTGIYVVDDFIYVADYSEGLEIIGSDSDNDGLANYSETEIFGTDPNNDDTDRDGLKDGWELEHGYDPLKWDNWQKLFGLYFLPVYILILLIIVGFLGYKFLWHPYKDKQEEALSKGFKSYWNFRKAHRAGFETEEEWQQARQLGFRTKDQQVSIMAKGFANYQEYLQAQEAGFETKEEWFSAQQLGITTKQQQELITSLGYTDYAAYIEGLNQKLNEIEERISLALSQTKEFDDDFSTSPSKIRNLRNLLPSIKQEHADLSKALEEISSFGDTKIENRKLLLHEQLMQLNTRLTQVHYLLNESANLLGKIEDLLQIFTRISLEEFAQYLELPKTQSLEKWILSLHSSLLTIDGSDVLIQLSALPLGSSFSDTVDRLFIQVLEYKNRELRTLPRLQTRNFWLWILLSLVAGGVAAYVYLFLNLSDLDRLDKYPKPPSVPSTHVNVQNLIIISICLIFMLPLTIFYLNYLKFELLSEYLSAHPKKQKTYVMSGKSYLFIQICLSIPISACYYLGIFSIFISPAFGFLLIAIAGIASLGVSIETFIQTWKWQKAMNERVFMVDPYAQRKNL